MKTFNLNMFENYILRKYSSKAVSLGVIFEGIYFAMKHRFKLGLSYKAAYIILLDNYISSINTIQECTGQEFINLIPHILLFIISFIYRMPLCPSDYTENQIPLEKHL